MVAEEVFEEEDDPGVGSEGKQVEEDLEAGSVEEVDSAVVDHLVVGSVELEAEEEIDGVEEEELVADVVSVRKKLRKSKQSTTVSIMKMILSQLHKKKPKNVVLRNVNVLIRCVNKKEIIAV